MALRKSYSKMCYWISFIVFFVAWWANATPITSSDSMMPSQHVRYSSLVPHSLAGPSLQKRSFPNATVTSPSNGSSFSAPIIRNGIYIPPTITPNFTRFTTCDPAFTYTVDINNPSYNYLSWTCITSFASTVVLGTVIAIVNTKLNLTSMSTRYAPGHTTLTPSTTSTATLWGTEVAYPTQYTSWPQNYTWGGTLPCLVGNRTDVCYTTIGGITPMTVDVGPRVGPIQNLPVHGNSIGSNCYTTIMGGVVDVPQLPQICNVAPVPHLNILSHTAGSEQVMQKASFLVVSSTSYIDDDPNPESTTSPASNLPKPSLPLVTTSITTGLAPGETQTRSTQPSSVDIRPTNATNAVSGLNGIVSAVQQGIGELRTAQVDRSMSSATSRVLISSAIQPSPLSDAANSRAPQPLPIASTTSKPVPERTSAQSVQQSSVDVDPITATGTMKGTNKITVNGLAQSLTTALSLPPASPSVSAEVLLPSAGPPSAFISSSLGIIFSPENRPSSLSGAATNGGHEADTIISAIVTEGSTAQITSQRHSTTVTQPEASQLSPQISSNSQAAAHDDKPIAMSASGETFTSGHGLVVAPPLTIGTSVVTPDSATQYQLGSRTLIPEGSALTASGTTYSLASSGNAVVQDGTTLYFTSSVETASGVLGTRTDQGYVVADQTLFFGSAITVSGTTYSLPSTGSNTVVVDGVPSSIQSLPDQNSNEVTSATLVAQTAYVVGEQEATLSAGSAVTVSGTTYSLPSDASAVVVNGVTSTIPSEEPLIFGSAAATPITNSVYMIADQTLTPGGFAVTVSGTTYSQAASGTALIVNGVALVQISSLPEASSVLNLGPLPAIPLSNSAYLIASQTLLPGGPAVTVSVTTYSLPQPSSSQAGGVVAVINGVTSIVPTPNTEGVSYGSLAAVPISDPNSAYLIGSQTLLPGGPAITVSGTTYSLQQPSASQTGVVAVINGATSTFAAPTTSELSFGLLPATPISSSAYLIASQTLSPGGPAITISGTTYSLPLSSVSASQVDLVAVINGITSTISTQIFPLATQSRILSFGSLPATPISESAYLIASQTLSPGGPAVTVSGTTYSLPSPSVSQEGVVAVINGVTSTIATSAVSSRGRSSTSVSSTTSKTTNTASGTATSEPSSSSAATETPATTPTPTTKTSSAAAVAATMKSRTSPARKIVLFLLPLAVYL